MLKGGFSKGLDDLDDGKDDEGDNDTGHQEDGPGASGGRQFVNLSSAARSGQWQNNEEEKHEPRPAAVKPTFRGKANLTGTGGGQDKTEGNRTYDFAVAFSGQGDDNREDR